MSLTKIVNLENFKILLNDNLYPLPRRIPSWRAGANHCVMYEQHVISSSLKIAGSFFYVPIMVNELTDVIGVLSKTRVNKDNCQLFSRKFGLVNQGHEAPLSYQEIKVTNPL